MEGQIDPYSASLVSTSQSLQQANVLWTLTGWDPGAPGGAYLVGGGAHKGPCKEPYSHQPQGDVLTVREVLTESLSWGSGTGVGDGKTP